MKSHIHWILIRFLVLMFFFMTYTFQSSGQYQIKTSVVGGGGNTTVGSGFGMLSTVGQPFVGYVRSPESHMFVGMWHQYDIVTSVEMIEDAIPHEYRLEQNYPNPFNPSTTIRFSIPERHHIRLSVYDLLGREVTKLIDEEMEAGWYSVIYNAEGLASGVYLYRIQTESFISTKRFIILK
jgi:hypothetical protein